MYIINTFLNNLNNMFPSATSEASKFAITSRLFYTILINAFLFGTMVIHLGLQVFHENLQANKPPEHLKLEEELGGEKVYVSYVAALMLVCCVSIPVYSIAVFILANYYYVLELFVKINIHVVRKKDCREKLEQHGDVAKGILGFAGKNVHASPGRLRDIQTLSTFQRVFYVLREWWIDLIFLLWAGMLIGYCYLFYDYFTSRVQITNVLESSWGMQLYSILYVCSFMVCCALFFLGNYHSFAVVFVTVILMLPLFLSFLFQAIVDKCQEASGKSVKKNAFAGIVTLAANNDKSTPEPAETRPPTAAVSSPDYPRPKTQTSRPPGERYTPFTSLSPLPTELTQAPPSRFSNRPPTVVTVRPVPRGREDSQAKTYDLHSHHYERSKSVTSVALSLASVEIPDNDHTHLL